MNLWRGYCSSLLSHLLHHPPPENYSSHYLTDPYTPPPVVIKCSKAPEGNIFMSNPNSVEVDVDVVLCCVGVGVVTIS